MTQESTSTLNWKLPTYEEIQSMNEQDYTQFCQQFNEGVQKIDSAIHSFQQSQSGSSGSGSSSGGSSS